MREYIKKTHVAKRIYDLCVCEHELVNNGSETPISVIRFAHV